VEHKEEALNQHIKTTLGGMAVCMKDGIVELKKHVPSLTADRQPCKLGHTQDVSAK